ncbi:MAG: hypothetical protein Q4G69_01425, partial [Planctomycetia bacterium]|nr:hypothetical protein [Planctomycetia bacterium]
PALVFTILHPSNCGTWVNMEEIPFYQGVQKKQKRSDFRSPLFFIISLKIIEPELFRMNENNFPALSAVLLSFGKERQFPLLSRLRMKTFLITHAVKIFLFGTTDEIIIRFGAIFDENVFLPKKLSVKIREIRGFKIGYLQFELITFRLRGH